MRTTRMQLGVALGVVLLVAGCSKKSSEGDGATPSGSSSSSSTTKPTPVTTTTATTTTATTTTTTPAQRDADAQAVRACCAAIRSAGNAAKTPSDKAKYDSAATACDGIANLVKSGTSTRSSAMGQIRASLHGEAPPPACN